MTALLQHPSVEHEDRVNLLEDMAILMGFESPLRGVPSSLRPDVFRYNRQTGGLFIADAKATETPGSRATQHRFLAYTRWIAQNSATLDFSICAICCTEAEHCSSGWRKFLGLALATSGVGCRDLRVVPLDYRINLIIARLRQLHY